MKRTWMTALALAVLTMSAVPARADVRTDEKTRVELAGLLGRMMNMFGGKGAREGVTSTVVVKGDRKVTLHEDNGQIIDLAEEKVYDLDLKHKSYKVTTFAEMRRRLEEQQRKAAEMQQKREERTAKEKPAEPDAKQPEVEFDLDIKNTGQKKNINGFDTQQTVMTITVREKGKTLEQAGGMVVTSDMWMTPSVPALKEIAAFDLRYAQKMYGGLGMGLSADQMAQAMVMYPMLKPAFDKMTTEGSKLSGTAIETIVTMDAVKSAEQVQQDAKQQQQSSAQDDSSKTPTSVGGALGGFMARRMAKKPSDDKEKESGDKSRTNIMTSTTEVLKIATDVSAAEVAVPAGFKENK
jgi:hypothetical protein